MIITATPYRVSLLGGGTDYPTWYRERGGRTVGFAIDRYCYLGVSRAPIGQGCRYRIAYSRIEDRELIDDIEHPGARGVLRYLGVRGPVGPVTVTHLGDLPSGGGLGASSAYVVGLLQALTLLLGRSELTARDLAREAVFVEQHVIGETVGDQDQTFVALGGLRELRFYPDADRRPFDAHRLAVSPGRLAELERSLVLAHTGTMRYAHAVAAQVVAEIPRRATQLERLAELAGEGVALLEDERRPLAELGPLLESAWRYKRELCREVTNPLVDALHDRGLALGAGGGKLLGAGGGGFALFIVDPDRRATFERELGVPCVSVRVDHAGSRVVVASPPGDPR